MVKNFYPSQLSQRLKYGLKEKKISKYIINNSEIYSDNSDEEISDKESIDA